MGTYTISYRFVIDGKLDESFELTLDEETARLVDFAQEELPDWTALDFVQCANCPLKVEEVQYCPFAANMAGVVSKFDELVSFDLVNLEVTTAERHIVQETSAQRAIGSLMGLICATSGCPHAAYFRPMARFHLPLAGNEETSYRATSMYLLGQYFRHKDGNFPDLDLKGLEEVYEAIQVVNVTFAQRLRAAVHTDSSINAVILLDMLAKTVPYAIKDSLDEIRPLFKEWLNLK